MACPSAKHEESRQMCEHMLAGAGGRGRCEQITRGVLFLLPVSLGGHIHSSAGKTQTWALVGGYRPYPKWELLPQAPGARLLPLVEPCPPPSPPAPKQQDTWAGKGKETEAKRNLTPGGGGSLKNHPPWPTIPLSQHPRSFSNRNLASPSPPPSRTPPVIWAVVIHQVLPTRPRDIN